MKIIPFGEVAQDRYEISKKYGLIEKVGGIWRLTEKCKKNYTFDSYFYYLQGRVEKPNKIGSQVLPIKEPERKLTPAEEIKTPERQKIIEEILMM